MKISINACAKADLGKMDKSLQIRFFKHFRKLLNMPPRRHMQHGVPFFVEDVTKQARLVYNIENDTLYVIRCFAIHKEYEKWFGSFR